jgi:2-oxo-3-hexenedioate decarboxylase
MGFGEAHELAALAAPDIAVVGSPMVALTDPPTTNSISREVLTSLSTHNQIATFSSRPAGLTLDDAYRVTPLLRAAFEARGEKITGRKIGFTNREMWKVYSAKAPIWGYVTDHTTKNLRAPSSSFRGAPAGSEPGIQKQSQSSPLDSGSGQEGRPGMTDEIFVAHLADFAEPRIEPEIMFGLKAAPSPGMSETALLDCIEWVSLGYEIVQSIYPGWKFAAADTVAANGVHGALLVGERHAIAQRKAQWLHELATFQAELYRDGELSQRGGGALVLDSPLLALRHLVELLAHDPHNPPLAAGEIITTGTLTLAMPVSAGQTWTTKVSGIPLEEISVRFE